MLRHQFCACHRPRQPPRFCSSTRWAASAKVGTPWTRRLSARGSPPERASMRLARACSRALASGTSVAAPSPSSRRRPRMTSRWTQLRVPVGWTNRYRPFPSAWRPGGAERTKAAESAFVGMASSALGSAGSRDGRGYNIHSAIIYGIGQDFTARPDPLSSHRRIINDYYSVTYGFHRTNPDTSGQSLVVKAGRKRTSRWTGRRRPGPPGTAGRRRRR